MNIPYTYNPKSFSMTLYQLKLMRLMDDAVIINNLHRFMMKSFPFWAQS